MLTRLSKNSLRGFTLVELLAVLALLFVISLAGTKLDLVDLVDPMSYLEAKKIDSDSDALIRVVTDHSIEDATLDVEKLSTSDDQKAAVEKIKKAGYRALRALELAEKSEIESVRQFARELLPDARKADREQRFLLQIICRELGRRREQTAVPALSQLAKNPDYFISKHANEALALIDGSVRLESQAEIPKEIVELLPKGTKVGIALPGSIRENMHWMATAMPPETHLKLVSTVVSAIGNVEISRATVLCDTQPDTKDSVNLILVEGRFHQSDMVELLGQLGAEQKISTANEWVGVIKHSMFAVPLTVAMVEGRVVAISPKSDSIDDATLLKIAKALKVGH